MDTVTNIKDNLVSVIMPAYNAGKFIAESIACVQNQTFSNWELVIVDDGSTDNTAEVVKSFLTDTRIRYIYQENAKAGKARNNAIRSSTGTFLAFLDADDIWPADKLEKQMALFANPKIDLIFTNGYSFSSTINEPVDNMNTIVGDINMENSLPLFLERNQIPNLSVVVKKSAVEAVGLLSEAPEIIEDYHLWLKLMLAGYQFYGMKEKLFYYRIHAAQTTANDYLDTARAINAITSLKNIPPAYKETKAKCLKNWYKRLFTLYPPKTLREFNARMKTCKELNFFLLRKLVFSLLFVIVGNKKFNKSFVKYIYL
jgi:teichuronic acid biosynthesis glycosyltransferase TuaG